MDKYAERLANVRSSYRNGESEDFMGVYHNIGEKGVL